LQVIVDNYDHVLEGPYVRHGTTAAPFTVVYPPFPSSSGSQRSRNEKGSVHPKIWIFEFDNFLRVSISSTNLGSYGASVVCFEPLKGRL
jgi:hypothetical protein